MATLTWYGLGMKAALTGNVDFDSDTFYAMLCTSSYTPNQDTHDYRDDVTNEVSGTGYTAGGKSLGSATVTYDGATNQVQITWPDVTWPSSTITARTAVIYKRRGGAASADELIAYATESAVVSTTGGTFTLDLASPSLTVTV